MEGVGHPSETSEKMLISTHLLIVRNLRERLQHAHLWLEQERSFSHTERCLLESLLTFKDEDLEGQHQLVTSLQERTKRLTEELRECRSQMLRRHQLLNHALTENARLQAANTELKAVLASYETSEFKRMPYKYAFVDTPL